MKRILIDRGIEKLASDYKKEVKALANIGLELDTLKQELSSHRLSNEADYVDVIINHLDEILDKKPDGYGQIHTTLFADYDVGGQKEVDLSHPYKLKDASGAEHEWRLYMHIVNALQYDAVQEKIFPKYANSLGIRSCVYCNTQFAVSAKKGKTDRGKRFRSTYTLDHYKPKSDFPYLAVAFYNLYPCCSSCNQTKSSKPPIWELYCHVGVETNPYEFRLDNQSYLDYLMDWKPDTLKIEFLEKRSHQVPQDYDDYFHITKLYNNFKPEVEDVIWRKRIYNVDMLKAMQQSGVYTLKPNDVNRFIIGNYDRPDDILRRPLAKLIQDIARQLKLI